MQPAIPEISADELQTRLAGPQAPFLLDVREPAEFAEGRIPGARLLPLGTLAAHLDTLPRDRPIVAVCRSGGRSAHATMHLRAAGLDVTNLTGGMLGWPGPVEKDA